MHQFRTIEEYASEFNNLLQSNSREAFLLCARLLSAFAKNRSILLDSIRTHLHVIAQGESEMSTFQTEDILLHVGERFSLSVQVFDVMQRTDLCSSLGALLAVSIDSDDLSYDLYKLPEGWIEDVYVPDSQLCLTLPLFNVSLNKASYAASFD
jgi:hypothetical protein